MIVEVKKEGTGLMLAPEDRLDTLTAPEFDAVLQENLEGTETLTLDLGKLEYVSSAGLRVLLKAQKTMGARGGMKVINVSPVIMELFEITGFSNLLRIE